MSFFASNFGLYSLLTIESIVSGLCRAAIALLRETSDDPDTIQYEASSVSHSEQRCTMFALSSMASCLSPSNSRMSLLNSDDKALVKNSVPSLTVWDVMVCSTHSSIESG